MQKPNRVFVLACVTRGVFFRTLLGLSVGLAAANAGGCGRRGELLGRIDAGGITGGGGTGAVPDGATAPQAPRFREPQLVASLAHPARDADPTLTSDLLEMFFMSDRNGTSDIWSSRRASASDPWGPPIFVPDLSSFTSDSGPSISYDGLRIWLSSDRDGSNGHLFQASRASRLAPWSTPQVLSELVIPGPGRDSGPTVDATEAMMLLSSNRFGSAGFDLYVTTRPDKDIPWGNPRPVPGINSPFDDWDPFVTQGGLIVFFTSLRQGPGGIFWAMRQSVAEPFSTPLPVSDINSGFYDADATLSPDLSYMLFDSNRLGPPGNSEIYEAYADR